MRSLTMFVVFGLIVLALGVAVGRARSSPSGSDIWKVRLDTSSNDHWLLLDIGRIRVQGHLKSVFLLAHPKEPTTPDRFDAMKVVGDQGGTSLWSYAPPGSNYADAGGPVHEEAGESGLRFGAAPRFQDVDGDGSDDVVFVEHDFVLGRILRAVRIEP